MSERLAAQRLRIIKSCRQLERQRSEEEEEIKKEDTAGGGEKEGGRRMVKL